MCQVGSDVPGRQAGKQARISDAPEVESWWRTFHFPFRIHENGTVCCEACLIPLTRVCHAMGCVYHLLVILNSFCHFFGIFSSVLALDLLFFGDPPTSISSVNDFRHAISCSLKR